MRIGFCVAELALSLCHKCGGSLTRLFPAAVVNGGAVRARTGETERGACLSVVAASA